GCTGSRLTSLLRHRPCCSASAPLPPPPTVRERDLTKHVVPVAAPDLLAEEVVRLQAGERPGLLPSRIARPQNERLVQGANPMPSSATTSPVPFWQRLRAITLYPVRGAAFYSLLALTLASLLGMIPVI